MADFSIPGLTSQYNTDKIVQKLVDVKKVELKGMESDLQKSKDQRAVWNLLKTQGGKLVDASKGLYSFTSVFQDKLSTSSDKSVAQVSVTRSAQPKKFALLVSQMAAGDHFVSDPLPQGYVPPAGTYTIKSGKKETSFTLAPESTLDQLASAISSKSDGTLTASVYPTGDGKVTFSIAALKKGKAQNLVFTQSALSFAKDTKILQKAGAGATLSIPSANWKIQHALTKPPTPENTLRPSDTLTMTMPQTQDKYESLSLSFVKSASDPTVSASASQKTQTVQPQTKTDALKYDGVLLPNFPSQSPSMTLPMQTQTRTKYPQFYAEQNGKLTPISISWDTPSSLSVSLSELPKGAKLIVENSSADSWALKSAQLNKKGANLSGWEPKHPVSEAQDALFKLDGVPFTRPSNNVSKIIPGVTINLFSKGTTQIAITPDIKKIKNGVIKFVGQYNIFMASLNIVSTKDPQVISEITYFTDKEKAQAKKNLGALVGDSTISLLKSQLRTITIQTEPGSDYTILSQLGISSNETSQPSIQQQRRGYLEIDDSKLTAAIKANLSAVQNFWGSDTTHDGIVNTGLAKKVDSRVASYSDVTGLFMMRVHQIDTTIKSQNKKIADFKVTMKKYEAEQKTKYAQMEGTLDQLKTEQNSLSAFSNQNQNGN